MQVGLLDEIAQRLLNIEKTMKAEQPIGSAEPYEPISVTSETRVVDSHGKPWFSVQIVNDGPNNVLVLINSQVSQEWHTVKINEPYKLDAKSAVIRDVLLRCEPNETASVRMVCGR